MEGLKLFRPSSAPGKELCAHYETVITSTPNTARGVNFHKTIAAFLRKEKQISDIPPELSQALSWASDQIYPVFDEIKGIEMEFTLYDELQEFVTSGTVDLWGYTKEKRPAILDWKTGQERDYDAQICTYGLMLLDFLDEKEIDLYCGFVDQGRMFQKRWSYQALSERVYKIINKILDPRSPYEINRLCAFCDLRLRCPAWENERQLVARSNEILSGVSWGDIKKEPTLLARFIVAYKRFRTLVEKTHMIEEHAIEMMRKGIALPGVKKVERPGYYVVMAEEFIKQMNPLVASPDELLDCVTGMDLDKATALAKKYNQTEMPLKKTKDSAYLAV